MFKKVFIIITCLSLVLSLTVIALASNEKQVGKVISMKGEVLIVHKDEAKGIKVKVSDAVYQYDTIQTLKDSRVQILMEDDSLINLGENAKIYLKEYIYTPEENRRSSTLDLLSGKARFIVGKIFTARDSKFQVNTPTSVIGVRDTYFIVWVVSPELTTVITMDGAVVAKNVSETLVCESVVGKNYSCQITSLKCPTTPTIIPTEEMEKILMDTKLSPTPPEREISATIKDSADISKAGVTEKVEVPPPQAPTAPVTVPEPNKDLPTEVGNPNQQPSDNPSQGTIGVPPTNELIPPPKPPH